MNGERERDAANAIPRALTPRTKCTPRTPALFLSLLHFVWCVEMMQFPRGWFGRRHVVLWCLCRCRGVQYVGQTNAAAQREAKVLWVWRLVVFALPHARQFRVAQRRR